MNRTLALAGLLVLPACDQWHLSINSDGLVFISIIDDQGEPRDRFRLRVGDAGGVTRIMDVPASGEMTLTPAADGTVHLTLLAPQGCTVASINPQAVTVTGGEELRVVFDVSCG